MNPNEWILSTDTGISSKTIWAVMMGVAAEPGQRCGIASKPPALTYDVPHDPADFGRCFRLLALFPEWRSKTEKYQALNRLTLRGIWLMLEAFSDDPPELIVFENVPRIASRGRSLLDRIETLLRHYGYAVAETTHDCGEIGGLGQSRKRFLMVARHAEKVPPFLYEPEKRPLRSVGDVIGRFPLPGNMIAGPMHRVPMLQWKTWVRLAFVQAGSDWRSLNRLGIKDGVLRDYLIVPEMYNRTLGVVPWGCPSGTVTGNARPATGRGGERGYSAGCFFGGLPPFFPFSREEEAFFSERERPRAAAGDGFIASAHRPTPSIFSKSPPICCVAKTSSGLFVKAPPGPENWPRRIANLFPCLMVTVPIPLLSGSYMIFMDEISNSIIAAFPWIFILLIAGFLPYDMRGLRTKAINGFVGFQLIGIGIETADSQLGNQSLKFVSLKVFAVHFRFPFFVLLALTYILTLGLSSIIFNYFKIFLKRSNYKEIAHD